MRQSIEAIKKSEFCFLLCFNLFFVDFHLPFKNLVGFHQGFLENSHERIQLLLRVLGHNTDSQTGLTQFDHWKLNSVHVNA
jgi:hypothetical protein